MVRNIQLTLACGDYEITRPLIDRMVTVDGADLTVVTDMDSNTRHTMFLRGGAFDIAELSGSSYLMAKDRGMAIEAIPVFPHRRFRHGFVFINTGKGITKPKDLIGRRIGVKAYQATAMLWMRGILEHEYGVPHRSIDWVSDLDEDIPFAHPPGLRLTRLPAGQSVEAMLVAGEIDALLHTDTLPAIQQKNPKVARLFPDARAEETTYFAKTGIFPIMHVVAIRREIVERYPWLPVNLTKAFEEAKSCAMQRMRNPRIVPLAWYSEAWDEQAELLGADPWEYGLSDRNRANLEAMIGYSHEQGLIGGKLDVEAAFLPVGEGRKRGKDKI